MSGSIPRLSSAVYIAFDSLSATRTGAAVTYVIYSEKNSQCFQGENVPNPSMAQFGDLSH
jgi:hypothetical protein